MSGEGPATSQVGFSAERTRAFIDAVVAIAMTLLILPLMESVGEVAGAGDTAAVWLGAHTNQLLSFALSFVIIALFWMNHHRLFSSIERITPAIMWITVAWMLTIVWLPVATAITGQMPDDDPVAKALYIGTMIATPLLLLTTRLYLRRHPDVHSATPEALTRGIGVDLSMATLFAVSLIVALLVPGIGYLALLLMSLTGLLQRIFDRMLLRRPGSGPEATEATEATPVE